LDEPVCDLHTHTLYSDGTLTPEELIRSAKAVGLSAIAVTDHDITDGIDAAQTEAKKHGMEVIPGIELSASAPGKNGREEEMHILGYFLDYNDAGLQKKLAEFREARRGRFEKIIEKLAEIGVRLDVSKIKAGADGHALGRPHIARALVEGGHVSSVEEAFERYLRDGARAAVPKMKLTPGECLRMIKDAGGISSIAHPRFGAPKDKEGWEALAREGLDGIEVYHSQHTSSEIKKYEKIAKDLGLLVTGGSDFHAFQNGAKGQLGDVRLPMNHLDALRQKKASLARR